MEPNIPVGSEAGVARAVAGAEREQREGVSGKWVAHSGRALPDGGRGDGRDSPEHPLGMLHKGATMTEADAETGACEGSPFTAGLFARLLQEEYAKLQQARPGCASSWRGMRPDRRHKGDEEPGLREVGGPEGPPLQGRFYKVASSYPFVSWKPSTCTSSM
jgi:hypothetical protein